jgi:hypothetical protein
MHLKTESTAKAVKAGCYLEEDTVMDMEPQK